VSSEIVAYIFFEVLKYPQIVQNLISTCSHPVVMPACRMAGLLTLVENCILNPHNLITLFAEGCKALNKVIT